MTTKEFATRLLMLLCPWYVSRNLPASLLKAIFGDSMAPPLGWPPGTAFADWALAGPGTPIPAEWSKNPPIDPFGILPYFQPGAGVSAPPPYGRKKLLIDWFSYTGTAFWLDPEQLTFDAEECSWTFLVPEAYLFRDGTWTAGWRPTHFRITHTVPGLYYELWDTADDDINSGSNYPSGTEVEISWGTYDLKGFYFNASGPGDITSIEFYGEYQEPTSGAGVEC